MENEKSERADQTFGYYCDCWLNGKSICLKASSIAKYQEEMKNHIKPFFGGMFPGEISSQDVDRFIRLLMDGKNLSSRSVQNILTLFHTVFVYAEKRNGRKLQSLEIVYPRKAKKTVRVLDRQEETTLMNFLAREMDLGKFGIYIALRTGMRLGEVCALRWCDISFYAHTISVRHTVQRLGFSESGEYGRTRLVVGSPKSESSFRTIPLMPDIAALCRRFYSGSQKAYVLTGVEQCMEPRRLQRRLKACTDACRLDRVHFHTLRHTFATRCVEMGFDIKALSEILGHASVNITLNQYVHPDVEFMRKNMSLLKNFIEL